MAEHGSVHISASFLRDDATVLSSSISGLVAEDDDYVCESMHLLHHELENLKFICEDICKSFETTPLLNYGASELRYWRSLKTVLEDCHQTVEWMNKKVEKLASRTIFTVQNVLEPVKFSFDGGRVGSFTASRYFEVYSLALQVALYTLKVYVQFSTNSSSDEQAVDLGSKYRLLILDVGRWFGTSQAKFSDEQNSCGITIQRPLMVDVVINANIVLHLLKLPPTINAEEQTDDEDEDESIADGSIADYISEISESLSYSSNFSIGYFGTPGTTIGTAKGEDIFSKTLGLPTNQSNPATPKPPSTPSPATKVKPEVPTQVPPEEEPVVDHDIQMELIYNICRIGERLYFKDNKYKEAELYFKKILLADPTTQAGLNIHVGIVTYNLADCLFRQEKYAEAEPVLLPLLGTESDPKRHSRVVELLARVYLGRKEYKVASKYGMEALVEHRQVFGKESPQYAECLELLSSIAEERGDDVEAAAYKSMMPQQNTEGDALQCAKESSSEAVPNAKESSSEAVLNAKESSSEAISNARKIQQLTDHVFMSRGFVRCMGALLLLISMLSRHLDKFYLVGFWIFLISVMLFR